MPSTEQFTPSEPTRGIVIPADVYAQIETIRRSGEINMGDWRGVQAIANRRNFYAAVVWIQENSRLYFRGFIKGSTPDRELTDDEQETIDNAREGQI